MTFEQWLEENDGMSIDTREVAERLCADNPEGAEELVRVAKVYIAAEIDFFNGLEAKGYEFG